jgi:hypothetical protein
MSADQLDDLAISLLNLKGKIPKFTIRTRSLAWVELKDRVYGHPTSEEETLIFYKGLVSFFQERFPEDQERFAVAPLESVQKFLQIAWTHTFQKKEMKETVADTVRIIIESAKLKKSLQRDSSPDPTPDTVSNKVLEKLVTRLESLEQEVKAVRELSLSRRPDPPKTIRGLEEENLTELELDLDDEEEPVLQQHGGRKIYVSQARREVGRVSRSSGRTLEHEALELPSLLVDELKLLQVTEWQKIGMQTLWQELKHYFTEFPVPAKDSKGLAIKREIRGLLNAKGGLSKMIPMLFKAAVVDGVHSEAYLSLAQLCDDNVRELLRKRDVATHGAEMSRRVLAQTNAMNADLPDHLKAREVILATLKQDFPKPSSAPGGKKGKPKSGARRSEDEEANE